MLLEQTSFDNGQGGWAIWHMAESEETLQQLCPAKCAKCDYKNAERRREYYAVRALLAMVLGDDKEIAYLPSGQPFLTNHAYYISISHTKGYCAIAWHKTQTVGVDVEQISDRVSKVAHRFISPAEQQAIDTSCADDVVACQLLLWSAKEAAFKQMDSDSIDFLSDIVVDVPMPLRKEGTCRVNYWHGIDKGYDGEKVPSSVSCPMQYHFYPSFVFAVVCERLP